MNAAARVVAERAGTLAKLQVELARTEIKNKAKPFAIGIGLAVGAAILVLYMLGFALAGAAVGIASFLPTWAALLIVAGVLLIIVLLLGLFAKRFFEAGGAPVPEQAIEEAKLTQEVLKADGHA
jgi:hypothetical protein